MGCKYSTYVPGCRMMPIRRRFGFAVPGSSGPIRAIHLNYPSHRAKRRSARPDRVHDTSLLRSEKILGESS